jgi:hypothetical protein
MPTIKQSQIRNPKGWIQAPQSPVAAGKNPPPATQGLDDSRSPFMTAPMPLMASTVESVSRQFNGGTNLPKHRILPVKRGS